MIHLPLAIELEPKEKRRNKDVHFLVIGAAKSGTTWLANMLRMHPDIYIPEQKELHYFNKELAEDHQLDNYNYTNGPQWYINFFKDAGQHQIKGECSPSYLYDTKAAQRIFEFNPRMKIIAILRNPIDRTFSHYLHYIQKGTFGTMSFEKGLHDKHRMLISRSMYYQQLKRYYDIFPASQIKVMLFDDIVKNSTQFLADVQEFIGVNTFIPAEINRRDNITGVPAVPIVNRMLNRAKMFIRKKKLHRLNNMLRKIGLAHATEQLRKRNRIPFSPQKPKIRPETREYLCQVFSDDVVQLEALINRDLDMWRRI